MASTSSGISNANTVINCTCVCGERAIMLTTNTKQNSGWRFLRCPYLRDPARCCKFFRWVDQFVAPKSGVVSKDESRMKVQDEKQLLPFNNDEIVADIGVVVRCIADLREIQIAEIH